MGGSRSTHKTWRNADNTTTGKSEGKETSWNTAAYMGIKCY